MTAAVFAADDLAGDRIVLVGPEGHHAAAVRRVRVGEAVDVVDGTGTRASCTAVAVGRDTVELAVISRVAEPAPSPRLVLVQALVKGDRGELAVELATEVGADAIIPWAAGRCIARWEGDRGAKGLARWRATARAAAKQSRRAWWPEVAELHTTAELLACLPAAAATFVLHESAPQSLATLPVPPAGDVLLVVGPEGGLAADEVDLLRAAGAVPARLGSSVLRASTAGAVGLAVVSAQTTRWR